MSHVLEASLGLIHVFCAHAAVDTLADQRAQSWLAQRLPAVMTRENRIVWSPGSPLVEQDPSLLFDTDFRTRADWAGHPVVVAAQARREVFDRTAVVGYLRGEPVVSFAAFEAPDFSGVIVDWLNALPEIAPRMLDKLPRVTWEQAKQHAVAWHDELAARRVDGRAGDAGTVDRLDVPGMPGWSWVHLVTKRALDNEGAVMGHCVGDGGYDYMTWGHEELCGVRPDAGIWSLRDPTGRSRVTVEISTFGIEQAFGPENERPEAETAPAFGSLIARFREPREAFDVPYWLVLAKDGSTRMREVSEAKRDLASMRIGRGQVLFRLQGSDSWASIGDVQPFEVATGVTVNLRAAGAREIAQRVERVAEVDLARGIVRPPPGAEAISFTAPAVTFSDRGPHAERQPWFRQHERQQQSRRPR